MGDILVESSYDHTADLSSGAYERTARSKFLATMVIVAISMVIGLALNEFLNVWLVMAICFVIILATSALFHGLYMNVVYGRSFIRSSMSFLSLESIANFRDRYPGLSLTGVIFAVILVGHYIDGPFTIGDTLINVPIVHAYFITICVFTFLYLGVKNRNFTTVFSQPWFIYSVRRLYGVLPIFLGVSIITFFGLLVLGDPVDILFTAINAPNESSKSTIIKRFGLDRPASLRYVIWMFNFVIKGDFGITYVNKIPASELLAPNVYETLKLILLAFTLSFIISIPVGVLAAQFRGTWLDGSISAVALIGVSMPVFVFGIFFIITFGGLGLDLFPVQGSHNVNYSGIDPTPEGLNGFFAALNGVSLFSSSGLNTFLDWLSLFYDYKIDELYHLIGPALVLAFLGVAGYARLIRSNMLEVMELDYVRGARANGLSQAKVIYVHALRNAILPVVTIAGLSIGAALGGAPITETVFNWPGLGRAFVKSVVSLDLPVVLAITLLITLTILFSNLVTDLLYTKVDPRITLS